MALMPAAAQASSASPLGAPETPMAPTSEPPASIGSAPPMASTRGWLRRPLIGMPACVSLAITEVATLKQWIQEGASYEGHWAFQPLPAVRVPVLEPSLAGKNEIDAFIRERLQVGRGRERFVLGNLHVRRDSQARERIAEIERRGEVI